MRLSTVAAVVLFALCCASAPVAHAADGDPPNIVLILLDDVGYPDLNITLPGGDTVYRHDTVPQDRVIQTPNIDAFADQATLFTRAYAAAAVCSPSRAGILTGVTPLTFGFNTTVGSYDYRGLPEDDSLAILPRLLKAKGYRTFHVGKWHLGFNKERFLPVSKGYDIAVRLARETKKAGELRTDPEDPSQDIRCFFGFTRHHLPPPSDEETTGFINPCFDILTHQADGTLKLEPMVAPKRHSASLMTDWAECLIGTESVEAARSCVKTIKTENDDSFLNPSQASQPFFLTLWYWSPHIPSTSPPTAAENDHESEKYVVERDVLPDECIKPEDPNIDRMRMSYEELVCYLDHVLDHLLMYLEHVDNTLVIITSDNGGSVTHHDGYGGNGYVAGYKGGWTSGPEETGGIKEGSVRVPLIVRWLGHEEAPVVNASPVSLMDLLPTIAELAGVDLGPYDIDGVSFAGALGSGLFRERSAPLIWEQAYKEKTRDATPSAPPWAGGYRHKAAVLKNKRKFFTTRLPEGEGDLPNTNLYQLYQAIPDPITMNIEENENNRIDDPAQEAELLDLYDSWRVESAEIPASIDLGLSKLSGVYGGEPGFQMDGNDTVVYQWDDRFAVGGGSFTFLAKVCPTFGDSGTLANPMIIGRRGAGPSRTSWALHLVNGSNGPVFKGTSTFELLDSSENTQEISTSLVIQSGKCYAVAYAIEIWKRYGDVALDLQVRDLADPASSYHEQQFARLGAYQGERVILASGDACKAGGACDRVTVGGTVEGDQVQEGFEGSIGGIRFFTVALNETQSEIASQQGDN